MNRSPARSPKASTTSKVVIVAVDAAKDKHNLYSEIGDEVVEREFTNRSDVIEEELRSIRDRALAAGYVQLLFLCEPSGGCERVAMKTARRLGFTTAWANGEAVAKLRQVESNDTGKTDIKDPRVIHLLGRLDKTQKHREFEGPYALLRHWHPIYLTAETGAAAAKCSIHRQIGVLFPDFSFKKDFLFGPSGRALFERFGCNPYRIVKTGRRRLEKSMRKAAPRIRTASLDRLWRDAELSARHGVDDRLLAVQEKHLAQLFEDLDLHLRRKAEAARHMEKLYAEARQLDTKLPNAEYKVVTQLHLARLSAVTGPLSDFDTTKQLYRFLGINLRERQSGKYRGKTRISKKGNPVGRLVLSQSVLPLVRHDRLFGPVYHAKRKQGMPGSKAMAVMMRRFVKMLFGLYRSGEKFDPFRVFVPQSQYRMAA